jgi:hypothetical protein
MNLALPHVTPVYLAGGLAALVLVALAARVLRKVVSAGSAADALTFVVAGMATVMSGQGMWNFFTNDLHVAEFYIRVCMFGVFEAAMLVCALRTRRRIKAHMPVGIVGPAVWVMASLSGVLAATDVGWHFGPMLARLVTPLVAAFLWELGLSEERIAAGNSRIKWRITPERILVRLGVAEGTERTVTEVDAHRRLSNLARSAMRLRVLSATGAAGWRRRRAQRRLHRAAVAAVDGAGLGSAPASHETLMRQIGALYNATALAELSPPAPWESAPRLRTGHGAGAERTRTSDPHDLSRTGRTSAPHTQEGGPNGRRPGGTRQPVEVDREALVAELADQIRDAVDAGEQWRPDYPALIARTGYRRRWCEEVVRDAKVAVLSAGDAAASARALDVRTLLTPQDSAPSPGRADSPPANGPRDADSTAEQASPAATPGS